MQSYKISAYSTALFGSWYFIEDFNLLFDAGDGLSTQLLQKSRKIRQVFISHADRDHLCGLLHFNQLNARSEGPTIYYPKDCKSFEYLAAFSKQFDQQVQQVNWLGLDHNQCTPISKQLSVQSFLNRHKPASEGQIKSLSFHLLETRKKLKEEYFGLAPKDIQAMKKERGAEALTHSIQKTLISYSGDTPVEYDGRWDETELLIHEATFLRKEDKSKNDGHSSLENLIEMLADTQVKALIVGHFSSRYKNDEILEAIRNYCQQYKLQIPVYAVLPAQTSFDILSQNPVNQ